MTCRTWPDRELLFHLRSCYLKVRALTVGGSILRPVRRILEMGSFDFAIRLASDAIAIRNPAGIAGAPAPTAQASHQLEGKAWKSEVLNALAEIVARHVACNRMWGSAVQFNMTCGSLRFFWVLTCWGCELQFERGFEL